MLFCNHIRVLRMESSSEFSWSMVVSGPVPSLWAQVQVKSQVSFGCNLLLHPISWGGGDTWWRFCWSSMPHGAVFLIILTANGHYKPFLLRTPQFTWCPQSFNDMRRTGGNNDKTRRTIRARRWHTGCHPGRLWKNADGLDPALTKALSVMTSNIIKVIDWKTQPG